MKAIFGRVAKAARTIEAEFRMAILKVNLPRQQQMEKVLARSFEVTVFPWPIVHDVSFPALRIWKVLPQVARDLLKLERLWQFLGVAFSHGDDLN